MGTEENKALVRRMEEALNKQDWAGFAELLAVDFVYHNPATPQVRSRDDFISELQAVATSFPPAQWSTEEWVAEGDKVVCHARLRGVHSATYWGVPPSGKEAVLEFMAIWRISGGKLVEDNVVADVLGWLTQIGAIPAPAQPTIR